MDIVALTAFLLVLRQVIVVTVSLHMHRGASHKACEFHPALERMLRVWNYLWSGSTRVWAVMHRAHHAQSDKDGDPHSPRGRSVWSVLKQTSDSYFEMARALRTRRSDVVKYDVGLPDDAFERFTVAASARGVASILLTRVPVVYGLLALAFGWQVALCLMPGAMFSLWTSMILLVNGFAHRYGYRSFETREDSTNVFPVDVFAAGELLHHNHHAFPGRANMAVQPFEVDTGYWVLVVLTKLRLARLKSTDSRQSAV